MQCSPYQVVTSKFTIWSNTSYHLQLLEVLLKLPVNKLFQKICKLWSKQILTRKGSKYGKTKSIHSYSLWLLYLNADWFLLKHCRLTIIFSWASVSIPDFLNQQETFATSTTRVTKLTLAAKAVFICAVLCFDVLKYFSLIYWLTGC